ncbi:MAG: diguanylate cyclase [Ardenticatenaceae bacterium]|nr:diguanylate cyclase [Ardenticatenaceae bacterium]MCB9443702.1 diguanylate cyclase [Ardenticatenaceae bacterium]
MPRKAWVYIGLIYIAGLSTTIWAVVKTDFSITSQWLMLLGLVIFATSAQLIKAEAPDHQLYHTTLVFQFAGVILLEPFFYALLVIIPHLIEWIRERMIDSAHLRDWYLQPFNICVHIISGVAAYLVYTILSEPFLLFGTSFLPVNVITAAVVYVFFNHILTGLALHFARGVPFHESGILELGNLLTDLVMLLMGFTIAKFWEIDFWLIWIAMAPLLLIYRALTIPNLERQAQMDPKTGVWNAGYFTKNLQEELMRAQGLNRPLTIVMADLDLLRNINNTYGHLAGDVVLQGVARLLQELAEPYDTVARFGGEEFAILMPETTAEEAFLRVEAMRIAIAESEFDVATHEAPLKATMSFGIAAKHGDDQSATKLVHCADIAVYQSKQNGRNQTYVYNYKRDANLIIPTAVTDIIPTTSLNDNPPGTDENLVPLQPAIHIPHTITPEPIVPEKTAVRTSSRLKINAYIISVTILAVVLAIPLDYNWSSMNWWGLLAFAVLIFFVELLSIEIYVRDVTVSTSAAPYLAGVLLFGPGAAVLLAPIIAGIVYLKQKTSFDRLIFNASNHVISGLLCAWPLSFINTPVLNWPIWVQIVVSVVAAILIYLSTTWLLAGAVSLYGNMPVFAVWKERFKWLFPYYVALGFVTYAFVFSFDTVDFLGIFIVLIPLLMLRFSQKQYIGHTEGLVNQLRITNNELRNQAEEITLLNEELLLTLARSIDLRDPYVMEHSKNVARYAVLTAEELGLAPDRIEHIRKAGLLHDIGKLGIPETILFKPSGLSDEEYEIIKEHVNIGADLIYGCHSLRVLIPFVKYHHERYDGRGYPVGLAGKKIPLEARILNIADAVEAMASDRPYKKAMPPTEILAEVKRCAGTQFDPQVVAAFCNVVEKQGCSVIVNSARDVAARGQLQFVSSEQWPQFGRVGFSN